jgi:pantoate--beta-alanine ligase
LELFHTIADISAFLSAQRKSNKTIGFVPTMGALHNGHLTLVRTSKKANDITVCSVFVNPTQFNNAHDLSVYPRTLEADCQMLESVGCDVVFAPSAEEMYPQMPVLKVNFGSLETVLEGEFRPGHFNGVGIVVSKLFNIVQPNDAYFGQKDLQQCVVVRQLIRDLGFQLTLHICPTVREADGLAMSSRNRNLSPEQRSIAPRLFEALSQAQLKLYAQSPEEVRMWVKDFLSKQEGIQLEYFDIIDTETLESLDDTDNHSVALVIAAFLGKTRLIDNLWIGPIKKVCF